jgi:spore coat polysaccharide biosynthesis predicted glycosyltransferase SpsG
VRDDVGARNTVRGTEFETCVRWIPWKGDELAAFKVILDELKPRVIVTDINIRGRVDEYLATIFPAAHVSLHEHNYPLLSGDKVIAPTVRPLQHSEDGTPDLVNFIGADYVLLPPEIFRMRDEEPKPSDPPKNVVVTLGGADPKRLTLLILSAIHEYGNSGLTGKSRTKGKSGIKWTVILGPASGYDMVDLAYKHPQNIEFRDGAKLPRNEFIKLLASADTVITNGGTTLYEALALGRPVIAIPQNEFESEVVKILSGKDVCVTPSNLSPQKISEIFEEFMEYGPLRMSVAEKGGDMFDGLGSIRVAKMIVELIN